MHRFLEPLWSLLGTGHHMPQSWSQSQASLIVLSLFFALPLFIFLLTRLFRKPVTLKKTRNIQHQSSATTRPGFLSSLSNMKAYKLFVRSTPPPDAQNAREQLVTATVVTKSKQPENWDRLVKQPYDAFLVLDVEATCVQGTDFDWPNEIIEWPVCLMRWQDKDDKGRASKLVVVDEFRSFVKPTWRPQLSEFCTSLTGITQTDVQHAPKFAKVLKSFSVFLAKHGLIDSLTGERLQRFTWCSDGPFDIRDFVVKQCFISKVSMPEWLKGDVLDVRKSVGLWLVQQDVKPTKGSNAKPSIVPRRPSLNISQQLRALDMSGFEGRQHCGIDDTRNIARIIAELARRGVRLEPNTVIRPGRRWQWMGKPGVVLEEYCT